MQFNWKFFVFSFFLFVLHVDGLHAAPALTVEERAWLQKHLDEIHFCYNPAYPPVQFKSPKSNFQGLAADVVSLFEKRLGVNFSKHPVSRKEDLKSFRQGKLCIVAAMTKTGKRAENALFTQPYIKIPSVIVTSSRVKDKEKLEDFEGMRVGVKKNSIGAEELKEKYAGFFEIVEVDSPQEGLRDVAFGVVDAFILGLALATHHIEKEGLTNIHVAGDSGLTVSISMAVSKEHPVLFSIVSKTLADIPMHELKKISKKWLGLSYPNPLLQKTFKVIFFGILFIMLIVMLDRLWLKKKLQLNTCELEENKRRIGSIIEDAPIGIFTSTLRGTFLAANDQMAGIFGYSSPGEVIEQVRDIEKDVYSNPEDRHRIVSIINREGRIINQEIEFKRRDGSPIWVSLSMRKVVNGSDEVTFEGFLQDITDNRNAARIIEESQSFLEMALDVADAGTWQHSIATGKVYHSPAWYRVLGYEPNEFEPTYENWWNIVHPDDKAMLLEKRREFEVPFNTQNLEVQYRMKNKDGAYQWIVSKGKVFSRDDQGVPSEVMGVIYDIQKFKDAETRLMFEVAAKEETKKRLEHEVYHDPLTGLGNRSKCMRDIGDFRFQMKGSGGLGILYFDVVNFGQVNHAYGQSAGDELLKAITEKLLAIIGPDAGAHRVGGDQFAVLKKASDPEACVAFGRHVQSSLPTSYFIQGEKIEIAFVFGVGFGNKENEAPENILNMAVLAHDEAKKKKNGDLVFYDDDLHKKEMRRLTLAKTIKTALANGEFYLEYQPFIHARSGRLYGCEALLRWRNSQYGPISPGEFIPVAEESGQISLLGEWALENAFRFWTESGFSEQGLILAINVSGHQFSHQGFAKQIEILLTRTGINPKSVELEVTETALMENARESVTKLGRLRKLGVRISIDDFGTGYSSLDYLRQLSADTLKVDISFVQKLEKDQKTHELVRAMVNLARIFDMEVVAEGVETVVQKDILRNLTCDYFQGYLFSKPVRGGEISGLVDRTFF